MARLDTLIQEDVRNLSSNSKAASTELMSELSEGKLYLETGL
jgi:hypothetical protein